MPIQNLNTALQFLTFSRLPCNFLALPHTITTVRGFGTLFSLDSFRAATALGMVPVSAAHLALVCYLLAMGKTALLRLKYFVLASSSFLAFGFSPSPLFAQAPTTTNVPSLPTDPKELILLAAKSNGLIGPDVKPWHLRATFKALDEKGNTTDQGTYEELWASQTKFRRTFVGIGYSQTDYGTEHGTMRSGDRQLPPNQMAAKVRAEFVEPLPDVGTLQRLTFALKPTDANGTKLSCLSLVNPPTTTFPAQLIGETYCRDTDRPIDRIHLSTPTLTQAVHRRILNFQGRFIPGDLRFVQKGKTILTAHLDSLEELATFNDADFAPSSDAIQLPRRVNISAGVAVGMLVHKTAPIYPEGAKPARISGVVVLEAHIGRDGHILDLHVVSGPPALQQSALDAVRTWVYRPYLLNGELVEVVTSINVIYTLSM